eukprot:CAMPEP_0114244232 /NCGR_PEP_ID=MMETSP0058-20121206/11227_1 /TAXON_ID=36894 /ORGANISM="Pyramimonas parkeae, CCMP726" /LENGTH=451 /DNA_ID=CAMNT_0001357153 /DNA_START=325 /DNA_END=1680 /DNA_ORIENTATION=+
MNSPVASQARLKSAKPSKLQNPKDSPQQDRESTSPSKSSMSASPGKKSFSTSLPPSPSKPRPKSAAGRGVDDSGARRAFYARFVRPPTGKHFTSSPTGVSVLNSNPDFDGDCIKQHDFGVARAKSARLQGYTKYLHKELTARELEMLRLDAANMRDANRKLAMSEEEWHKVGAQKQEEAAEAHRSREEQMRRNMREMRRAQLELKDGIQHVQRRKDAQIYDKKRAWELDVQRTRQLDLARRQCMQEQAKRLAQDTSKYKQSIEEQNRKREQQLQARMREIHDHIEIRQEHENVRRRRKEEEVRAWSQEMKERYHQMKMRAYKGSDDIQQINQWEATRKMMLDEDIARRNDSLHHNEKELRERARQLAEIQKERERDKRRHVKNMRRDLKILEEKQKFERACRADKRREAEEKWKQQQKIATAQMEDRVASRRAAYKHEMGLGPPPTWGADP